MAIATLVIGVLLFVSGIVGQSLTRTSKPAAHSQDRRGLQLVLTVGSLVIGAWLLIYSAVRLLQTHHPGS